MLGRACLCKDKDHKHNNKKNAKDFIGGKFELFGVPMLIGNKNHHKHKVYGKSDGKNTPGPVKCPPGTVRIMQAEEQRDWWDDSSKNKHGMKTYRHKRSPHRRHDSSSSEEDFVSPKKVQQRWICSKNVTQFKQGNYNHIFSIYPQIAYTAITSCLTGVLPTVPSIIH